MRSPEEIKKGLAYCANDSCLECPYDIGLKCGDEVMLDALAYIQKLESRLAKSYEESLAIIAMVDATRNLSDSYADRLAQVERERDAAVEAIEMYPCFTCENISSAHCKDCLRNRSLSLDRAGKYLPDNYIWRGVCKENTKEDIETMLKEDGE